MLGAIAIACLPRHREVEKTVLVESPQSAAAKS
jgi:hypothetical protein